MTEPTPAQRGDDEPSKPLSPASAAPAERKGDDGDAVPGVKDLHAMQDRIAGLLDGMRDAADACDQRSLRVIVSSIRMKMAVRADCFGSDGLNGRDTAMNTPCCAHRVRALRAEGQRAHAHGSLCAGTIGHVAQPGSHLLLQMHYGPSAVEQVDQTEINLFFAQEPIQREVETYIMNPAYLDGGWDSFIIPPNQLTTFHGSMLIPEDMSLISITPHCHLLGKAWEVFARSQDALDTIPLISIPDWDFNWQGIFTYPQMVHLPEGYILEAYSTYDNTADNPFNPNDPPETMWWGDFTTEEMFVLFLQGVPYEEGDEDIVLSTPDQNTMVVYQHDNLFPAWPNPVAQGEVKVGFHLRQAAEVTLALYDLQGRQVQSWLTASSRPAGRHLESFSVDGLTAGTYVYQLRTSSGTMRSAQLQVLGK